MNNEPKLVDSGSKFYVYIHIKLTDGKPFYVGKGSGNRGYSKKHRSKWWERTVGKYGFDVILLEEGLIEEESFKREIYWIDRIGRKDLSKGTLINMTDGGEGQSGRIMSEETKCKLRYNNLGKKHTEETKFKMSNTHKGNKYCLGYKCSDVTKQKLSDAHKGKVLAPPKHLVLDRVTGIYYTSISEAAIAINVHRSSLNRYLTGVNKNKTNMIIV